MKGSYNAVVSVILVVKEAQGTIAGLFANLPKLPANNAFSGLGAAISEVGKFLKPAAGLVRGTGVEFVSLSLILAQTVVLVKQGLGLVLARFGITIAELGTSFLTAAGRGKVFNSVLTTLSAGLTGVQLAAVAGAAALVLFFSKADFSNELGKSFDELK